MPDDVSKRTRNDEPQRSAGDARASAPWQRGTIESEPSALDVLAGEPPLAELVERFGPYRWPLRPPFQALVGSIVSQSVSGASANAVSKRLEAVTQITPQGVLHADRNALRHTGLSWSKVDTIQRVARFTQEGNLEDVAALDDAAVVSHLSRIKGIGPWTAEMFLLFCLGRLDVWPVGDLTVRQQIERLYRVEGRPAVQKIGERFRPYRSAVVWYLWRAGGA